MYHPMTRKTAYKAFYYVVSIYVMIALCIANNQFFNGCVNVYAYYWIFIQYHHHNRKKTRHTFCFILRRRLIPHRTFSHKGRWFMFIELTFDANHNFFYFVIYVWMFWIYCMRMVERQTKKNHCFGYFINESCVTCSDQVQFTWSNDYILKYVTWLLLSEPLSYSPARFRNDS